MEAWLQTILSIFASAFFSVLGIVVGTFVGALVTWLVARHYFQRASDDLLKQSENLRRLQTLTLKLIKHPDWNWAEIKYDKDGYAIGLSAVLKPETGGGDIKVKDHVQAKLTDVRGPAKDSDS